MLPLRGRISPPLLVPERDDWIEARGALGGVEAEHHADRAGDGEGQQVDARVEGEGHVQEQPYLFAVVRGRDVHVWPWGFMFDRRPRVHVGVGVRIR